MDDNREKKLNTADSAGNPPDVEKNPVNSPAHKAKTTRQEAQRQRAKVTKRPPLTAEELAMMGVEAGEAPKKEANPAEKPKIEQYTTPSKANPAEKPPAQGTPPTDPVKDEFGWESFADYKDEPKQGQKTQYKSAKPPEVRGNAVQKSPSAKPEGPAAQRPASPSAPKPGSDPAAASTRPPAGVSPVPTPPGQPAGDGNAASRREKQYCTPAAPTAPAYPAQSVTPQPAPAAPAEEVKKDRKQLRAEKKADKKAQKRATAQPQPELPPEEGPPEERRHKRQKQQKQGHPGVAIALFCVGIVVALLLIYVGSWITVTMGVRPVTPEIISDIDDPLITFQERPLDNDGLPTTEIVALAAPSVVSLTTYADDSVEAVGYGSGVIVTADGYIVTNAHVIQDADTVRVLLDSGEGFTAEIVGRDEQNDLALLKINAQGLVAAKFADPTSVRRGQRVVAIGNAAGLLPGTPTLGIVSGVERNLALPLTGGLEVELPLIQTDAAINPGSSGGALVNAYGQVIGINVAKLPDAEIDNIGFAIPVDIVQRVVQNLLENGDVAPLPQLGIEVVPLSETNAGDDLPEEGLYISSVQPGSDIAGRGVSAGDVLLEAAGTPVPTKAALNEILRDFSAGDQIELLIFFAEEGESRTVRVRLYAPGDLVGDSSQALPGVVPDSQPDSSSQPPPASSSEADSQPQSGEPDDAQGDDAQDGDTQDDGGTDEPPVE